MPAQPQKLRFAINLGNEVLARREPDGQPGGITVALAHSLARELNVIPEFVTRITAGDVVADTLQDHWDIGFLAIDPRRETLLSFTEPYITIQGTIIVRSDSHWHSTQQIDKPGTIINVGKNAAYDLWLTRELHQATLNRLPSSQDALRAFVNGEGDMAAGIRQPLEKTARSHPSFRVLADNFTEIHQAVCVEKSRTSLYTEVAEALRSLKDTGELAQIIEQQMPST